MDPLPALPASLASRYLPRRVLGRGGFGTVVLAEDRELARPVAIKLLHAGSLDPAGLARFGREAKWTARLDHPHVVRVYDHGVTPDGTAFMVSEYVEGESLTARLASARAGPAAVAAWGAQLAAALGAAHRLGILHRDVKPDNVLIRPDGTAVLCDFGIARGAAAGTALTQEGLILGTPAYMAPELFLGAEPSPAADQWSLAATLAEALTGAPWRREHELGAILDSVRRAPRPSLAGRSGSAALDAALERGLEPDPTRRFPDLAQLEQACEAALGSLGPDPPPEGGGPEPAPGTPVAAGRTASLDRVRTTLPSAPAGADRTRALAVPAPRGSGDARAKGAEPGVSLGGLGLLLGLGAGAIGLATFLAGRPMPLPVPPPPEARDPVLLDAARERLVAAAAAMAPETWVAAFWGSIDLARGDAEAPSQIARRLLADDFPRRFRALVEAGAELAVRAGPDPDPRDEELLARAAVQLPVRILAAGARVLVRLGDPLENSTASARLPELFENLQGRYTLLREAAAEAVGEATPPALVVALAGAGELDDLVRDRAAGAALARALEALAGRLGTPAPPAVREAFEEALLTAAPRLGDVPGRCDALAAVAHAVRAPAPPGPPDRRIAAAARLASRVRLRAALVRACPAPGTALSFAELEAEARDPRRALSPYLTAWILHYRRLDDPRELLDGFGRVAAAGGAARLVSELGAEAAAILVPSSTIRPSWARAEGIALGRHGLPQGLSCDERVQVLRDGYAWYADPDFPVPDPAREALGLRLFEDRTRELCPDRDRVFDEGERARLIAFPSPVSNAYLLQRTLLDAAIANPR